MKIFIAGAKSVTNLNDDVKLKLMSIYNNRHSVLVGDCQGVDAAVQKFFTDLNYGDVTVFASNGKARYNIGNWKVENVKVKGSVRGFDFYKQKDIAMAEKADYGFMIWDGSSKGTLNNIINLIERGKKVLVYLSMYDKMLSITSIESLEKLIKLCPTATMKKYKMLLPHADSQHSVQLSLFENEVI